MKNMGIRQHYLTEKSLTEQLKLTEREIELRREQFSIDEATVTTLTRCKEIVVAHIDEIVDAFYAKQQAIPEVELLIGDLETFNRLHNSMKRYIIELFEGYYDLEYVNTRLRIGKVHKRIGVSPKLYVGAVNLLEEILDSCIFKYKEEMDKEGMDCMTCIDNRIALRRILMFDMQLVFDTYINSLISEINAAKNEVENYAESLEEIVKKRTRELEKLSRKDILTGLFNQRSFYEQIRVEIARAERAGQSIVLVYLDLNKFKNLNDTQGHKAGDALLATVGRVMRSIVREVDSSFRYGGDEFCILLPNSMLKDGEMICSRLIDSFDKEETMGVSFSIGIASMGPEKFIDMENFIKKADKAMYEAKAASKENPGHHVRCAGRLDQAQDERA